MSTSLKIDSIKVLVKDFARAVHNMGDQIIFINRTRPIPSVWDHIINNFIMINCNNWVSDLQYQRSDLKDVHTESTLKSILLFEGLRSEARLLKEIKEDRL